MPPAAPAPGKVSHGPTRGHLHRRTEDRERGIKLADRGRVRSLLRAVDHGRTGGAGERIRHVRREHQGHALQPRVERRYVDAGQVSQGRPAGRQLRAARVRKRTPSVDTIPAPPSVVALPPIPITIEATPASTAARISSPVPRVDATRADCGVLSAVDRRASPDAAAISTNAAVPHRGAASRRRPRARADR